MLRNLTLLAILAFATAFIASRMIKGNGSNNMATILQHNKSKKLTAISCGPDWAAINGLTEAAIPVIPGAGKYSWKISTQNDSAQVYFNQGINMYYSFHIIEAMASFKKAAKFDSGCAILYWAQALTYGPNINDLGYVASPEALQATAMAEKLSGKASAMEKALINAMSVRYTADSADATRATLNVQYTAMMKKAYDDFSRNADVQALYADAMMLEHPWDLWNIDGTPRPWTPLIETVLEKLLATTPDHPGANHYYIHVMEPSPFAAKALPSANRMGRLTPGLSHTVHMPSHIYLRTGQYNTGATVNENALNDYKKVFALYNPVAASDFLYVIHNIHMQTTVGMLAGRKTYSMQSAQETAASVPETYSLAPAPFGSGAQYVLMIPTLVNIRFGNWNELLTGKQPDPKMIYANILYHFGRGMALAHASKIADANTELQQIQAAMKDSGLYIPFGVFSPAIDGATVAENLLSGSIAMAEKNYPAAITAFDKAVTTEEHMVYTEPRDWLLNPKHYLGNAYLKAGQPAAAEKVLRKDLLNNSENGWALFGIYQALLAQHKNAAAGVMLARYKKAFALADVKLDGPVF
ncbi:tetratricopeptide repeat protein [Ferruginibacter profundus]